MTVFATLALVYAGNMCYHGDKCSEINKQLQEAKLQLSRAEATTTGRAIDFVKEYGWDNSKDGAGFSTAIRYGNAQDYEKEQRQKVSNLSKLLNEHKRKAFTVF